MDNAGGFRLYGQSSLHTHLVGIVSRPRIYPMPEGSSLDGMAPRLPAGRAGYGTPDLQGQTPTGPTLPGQSAVHTTPGLPGRRF